MCMSERKRYWEGWKGNGKGGCLFIGVVSEWTVGILTVEERLLMLRIFCVCYLWNKQLGVSIYECFMDGDDSLNVKYLS